MKRCDRFTLIELLVVIAIMSIIAAMLLPAMASAKYRVKNIACINQIRQMYGGLVTYCDDNAGYFPATSWGREHPSMIAKRYAVGSVYKWDFRPTLREYFGTDLNRVMKCPLANNDWLGASKRDASKDFYNIDAYRGGGTPASKTPYNFYFKSSDSDWDWGYKQPYLKLGDSYRADAYPDLEQRWLISDFVYYTTWIGTFTTHRGRSGTAIPGGNVTNWNVGYQLLGGAASDANFCRDDGSVSTYWQVSGNSVSDGTFLNFRPTKPGYLIPAN